MPKRRSSRNSERLSVVSKPSSLAPSITSAQRPACAIRGSTWARSAARLEPQKIAIHHPRDISVRTFRRQRFQQQITAEQPHHLIAVNHREILLRGRQQQIGGVANGIAVLQRVEFGDHRGAHRNAMRERAAHAPRRFPAPRPGR